jgi:hypothetical protein
MEFFGHIWTRAEGASAVVAKLTCNMSGDFALEERVCANAFQAAHWLRGFGLTKLFVDGRKIEGTR